MAESKAYIPGRAPDPRPFDLVLSVQGTAATPYLQKGDCTSQETWNRLQRTFNGDFIGFALWFN